MTERTRLRADVRLCCVQAVTAAVTRYNEHTC